MRYVSITYHGQYFIVDRESHLTPGKVSVRGTGVGQDTIFERIELGDNQVAFRTLDGRYLSAVTHQGPSPGALHAYAGERGPAQTFLEVWLPDDRIALRTHLGTFICAESNGKGDLVINRPEMGEWEKFFYEKPPEELLPKEEQKFDVTTSAQDARTTMDRPSAGGLRGEIFRPPGS
ncbi:MAG: hypothetical protein GEU74_15830 [Nitriliruptorales bacterium]|nr:hypothetical protein [Nitriliruptorales bacterium]